MITTDAQRTGAASGEINDRNWPRFAACRAGEPDSPDPEIFFSYDQAVTEMAINGYCRRCPVTEWCDRAGGRGRRFGIWGGKDHGDPTTGTGRPANRRHPAVHRPECGTQAGVDRHREGRERLCGSCGDVVRARCGTVEGWLRHRRAHERPCPPCAAAHDEQATGEIRPQAERDQPAPRICGNPGCDQPAAPRSKYCRPECNHLAQCGTESGYRAILANDLPDCDACRKGSNAYHRDAKHRRNAARVAAEAEAASAA